MRVGWSPWRHRTAPGLAGHRTMRLDRETAASDVSQRALVGRVDQTPWGKVPVEDLSFTVQPARVTGFLGLDAPTRGSATVNGRPYREHLAPLREIGAHHA